MALVIGGVPFLGACKTFTATSDVPVASAAAVLRKVPEVENSSQSPCWQQRQIAHQRSYLESAIAEAEGRKVLPRHATCTDPADAKPAANKPEAKTS